MGKCTKASIVLALVAALALFLCSCSTSSPPASGSAAASEAAQASAAGPAQGAGKHIIGVAVYDVADSEVKMFQQYLLDYIAKVCFDDVQFVYSGSILTEEELLEFIDDVAAMGGEGLMSFFNIDLKAEVERCASHGMYHIVASGTVSKEDFASVEDNEYFLGAIGPMIEMEYMAGSNMVSNFIANKVGDSYFIMSGGAGVGNEMHYQRTFGMLDMIETSYGVDLGQTKELAAVNEPTTIALDKVTVTISPGYMVTDEAKQSVEDTFKAGQYDVVLSTLPVTPVFDMLDAADVKIAQVDCYSQDNQLYFESGELDYLVGKYGSLIGPSFVALYNAITGHADAFRDDGKAFQIVQNFWSSNSKQDFNEKFAFASNITSPAYNYEDLYSICSEHNPSATLEDLRTLAHSCSFEDAQKRRS